MDEKLIGTLFSDFWSGSVIELGTQSMGSVLVSFLGLSFWVRKLSNCF